MDKIYIKTKKGKIFECYVSEQMNKPIYYPTESKTNGYIDYYDVERFLGIDSMYKEVKQLQQEKEKLIKWLEHEINIKNNIIKEFTFATEEYQKELSSRNTLMVVLSKLKESDKYVN